MKALIWIGCLVGASVIMTIFQHAIGAPLGPLAKTLLVVSAIALAVTLCKKVPPNNKAIDEDDEDYDEEEYDNEYIDTEYPDEEYPECIEEYCDNVYDDAPYTPIDENEGNNSKSTYKEYNDDECNKE